MNGMLNPGAPGAAAKLPNCPGNQKLTPPSSANTGGATASAIAQHSRIDRRVFIAGPPNRRAQACRLAMTGPTEFVRGSDRYFYWSGQLACSGAPRCVLVDDRRDDEQERQQSREHVAELVLRGGLATEPRERGAVHRLDRERG